MFHLHSVVRQNHGWILMTATCEPSQSPGRNEITSRRRHIVEFVAVYRIFCTHALRMPTWTRNKRLIDRAGASFAAIAFFDLDAAIAWRMQTLGDAAGGHIDPSFSLFPIFYSLL